MASITDGVQLNLVLSKETIEQLFGEMKKTDIGEKMPVVVSSMVGETKTETLTDDSGDGDSTVKTVRYYGEYAENQIICGKKFVKLMFENKHVLGDRVYAIEPFDRIKFYDAEVFTPPVGDDFLVFVVSGMTRFRYKQANDLLYQKVVYEKKGFDKNNRFYLYNFKPKMLDAWFFAFHKNDAQLFRENILDPLIEFLNESAENVREHEFIETTYYNYGIRPEVWESMLYWDASYKE